MRYIYTMKQYSAIKKNEKMPLEATWMDLETVRLHEVSLTEKEKYHIAKLEMVNLEHDKTKCITRV